MNVQDLKSVIEYAIKHANETYPRDHKERALTFAAVLAGGVRYHDDKLGNQIAGIYLDQKAAEAA